METERLKIMEFHLSLLDSIEKISMKEYNKEFHQDEVHETIDDLHNSIEYFINTYNGYDLPFIYLIVTKKDNIYIGHIECVNLEDDKWEIGYHINDNYSNQGFATEAVKNFTPFIMNKLKISKLHGICKPENIASAKVLEKSGYKFIEEKVVKYFGKNMTFKFYTYTSPTK